MHENKHRNIETQTKIERDTQMQNKMKAQETHSSFTDVLVGSSEHWAQDTNKNQKRRKRDKDGQRKRDTER